MSHKLAAVVLVVLVAGIGSAVPKVSLPLEQTGPMNISLVQGYSFDPLERIPELPARLAIDGYDRDYGYYLIQFPGPIRPEWKAGVEKLGADLLWYLPNYTFIARVAQTRMKEIRGLPQVRWLGLFQPAYKLIPGLETVDGPQTLIVVFFDKEDENQVLGQLRALGGTNIVTEFNRWNKSVKLDIDGSAIAAVARLPGVFWVEPYGEITPDNMNVQWVDQHGYSASDTTRTIWHKGVTGRYVVCGLTDTQLWVGHDQFRDTINNTPSPTHRKVIHYFGTQGAGSHGTHTGGTLCGNDDEVGGSSWHDGLAKDALLYFQYYQAFPSGWDMNVWFAGPDSGVSGLRALNHSMSLSRKDTFNTYVFADMTADQFVWNHRQFMHCNSMGNYGSNKMGHPVNAKSIIATGGTENGTACRNIYTSTSRGPTADGRRKPQLVSPGKDVYSASHTGASSYRSGTGTSMSTPNMTAATALIRCYFRLGFYPTGDTLTGQPREISAALNKAVAIVGADNDISGLTVPDNNVGWGRVNLDSSLYFEGDESVLWIEDDTTGLQTGDSALFTVNVDGAVWPFRVTLCWSDYPGVMQAALILVNDLNLTVISPTGTEYKGNVYSGGQSQPGGIYDTLNVEECFRQDNPELGTWTIKVKARNVPQGPQPFALAAIGVFGTGVTHDVSATEIVAPVGEIDSGSVVTPKAIVQNLGSVAEAFDVRLLVEGLYADTQSVNLAAGGMDTVEFRDWIAQPLGFHVARCSTMLGTDENSANDMVQDTFEVIPWQGIEEQTGLPTVFFLGKGRPNPFRNKMVIRYGLPRASRVNLRIYSATGCLVRSLRAGRQEPGLHQVIWNSTDDTGRPVSRGIYYCRLVTDKFAGVKKLIKVE